MRSKIFTRTVGYWPLQEDSGQALDHSGNENHATTTNVSNYGVSGPMGSSAMSFDGSSDSISLPQENYGTVHTVSSWGSVSSDQSIILSGPVTSNGDNYAIYYNNSSLYYKCDGEYVSASVGDLRSTGFHHFLISRDGAKVKFYLDGTKAGEGTLTNQSRTLTISAIGYGAYDNGYYWHGKIAYVRVWDYPLPEASIKALYNASRGGFAESSRKSS